MCSFPILDFRSILILWDFCWSVEVFDAINNSQLHEFLLHSLSSLFSAGKNFSLKNCLWTVGFPKSKEMGFSKNLRFWQVSLMCNRVLRIVKVKSAYPSKYFLRKKTFTFIKSCGWLKVTFFCFPFTLVVSGLALIILSSKKFGYQ